MPPFLPFAALSRATRASSLPKTPEPLADAQPTSPPRPRLRLKRRNASHLHAPTQQFLASVAAADVPIPSIEEPYVVDEDMLDTLQQGTNERIFSPPKTPAPGIVLSVSPRRYPDWSMTSSVGSLESSPECESSRPSTARSTQTSASLFSDLDQCLSPGWDQGWDQSEPSADDAGESTGKTHKTSTMPSRSRKARWTKAMSQHLWSTYLLYLQDPHVTPFRIGKCGIPPHGVCTRVAREAKRSWKGCSAQLRTGRNLEVQGLAPAGEVSSSFVQWPHTCAATRAHLREMCKANAGSTVRSHQYLANSPTPYGKAASRLRNRRFTPALSPSAFSSSDMAISLAVSTSDSMQAHGPLAQLTRSEPDPFSSQPSPIVRANITTAQLVSEPQRPRLGSPFMAQSYGPSSSASLAASLDISLETPRQAQTLGHQRGLQSPARVTRSRSNTQKRRDRQPLFEPRRIKRPSLGSDLWADPTATEDAPVGVLSTAEFSSTTSKQCDDLFVPRANIQELFETTQTSSSRIKTDAKVRRNLSIALEGPPRLGSPFTFAGNSRSVPNRFSSPAALTNDAARRPFATVQQPSENVVTTPKTSLASRLAYIDERLRDFRRRDPTRRRSDSPL
jgi:hypothetical protein